MSFFVFKAVFDAVDSIDVDTKSIERAVRKVAKKHDKKKIEKAEPIVKSGESLVIQTEFGSFDLTTGKFTEKPVETE